MTATVGARGAASPAPPSVIGHRGAASSAPENTLAGLRKAHEFGARWVEFDVRLSGDGRCILLHDDTVDRTSDGKGAASRLTVAELQRLDAGAWFAPEFAGERIPTFESVIDLLAELGLGANVEIKPAKGEEVATARATVEILRRRWPASLPPPLLSSFAPLALEAARDAAPEIARGHLFGKLPKNWREETDRLGCVTVHCDQKPLTRGAALAVIEAGYPLLVYTVNDPARAREIISWGAASVFTDCPDRIIAGLAAAD